MMDRPFFDRWRLVVFDFDGTIADSQHNIVRIMQHAFARGRIDPPSGDDVFGRAGRRFGSPYA